MKKIFIFLSMVVGVVLGGVMVTLEAVGGVVHANGETWDENVDGDDVETDEVVEDEVVELPELYIKAVNPGYKVDGINNVGEMIEIARGGNSDEPILLAGATVGYTNSSGNSSLLLEFPENSWMTGEKILLRLVSSPGSELANLTYKKTLALTGGIALSVNGEVVDEVCWTGKVGCHKAFNSAEPTTLVRNLETGEFEHLPGYESKYDAGDYRVVESEEEGKGGLRWRRNVGGWSFRRS